MGIPSQHVRRMIADPESRRRRRCVTVFAMATFLIALVVRRRSRERPLGAVRVETSLAAEGRPRFLLHQRPPLPRLPAVGSSALSPGGRAVLLRRRPGAVRLRRAALLVLWGAPGRRRRRALRPLDVLLSARAALPLVRPAAAGPVRAQRGRLLVRRRVRTELLRRAATLRHRERRLHARSSMRGRSSTCASRPPLSTARSSAVAPGVSAGVHIGGPPRRRRCCRSASGSTSGAPRRRWSYERRTVYVRNRHDRGWHGPPPHPPRGGLAGTAAASARRGLAGQPLSRLPGRLRRPPAGAGTVPASRPVHDNKGKNGGWRR